MNIDENNTWGENPDQNPENQTPKSLDEQEQINSKDLSQQIETENADDEAFQDFETDNYSIGNDKPLTKNLLGDNPPGSEEAAFNAGIIGDASAEQFKYDSENLVEGFRENIDKTEEEIALDKKLKDQSLD